MTTWRLSGRDVYARRVDPGHVWRPNTRRGSISHVHGTRAHVIGDRASWRTRKHLPDTLQRVAHWRQCTGERRAR